MRRSIVSSTAFTLVACTSPTSHPPVDRKLASPDSPTPAPHPQGDDGGAPSTPKSFESRAGQDSAPTDERWGPFIERAIASCQKKEDTVESSGAFSGRPSDKAFERLATAFGTRIADVRKCLVRTAARIGSGSDPMAAAGAQVLRDERFIALFFRFLDAKPSTWRDTAIDVLLELVPPAQLSLHGERILRALRRRGPDETLLLLVAKAKPHGGSAVIDKVLRGATFERLTAARVVRAALGDAAIEDEFIRRFRAISKGDDVAPAAMALALVGTRRTLSALCDAMRSPMIAGPQPALRRSVRVDIAKALRHVFPLEPALFDTVAKNDAAYDAIESFCRAQFGTRWSTPRPPFLWVEGGPIPVSPPARHEKRRGRI